MFSGDVAHICLICERVTYNGVLCLVSLRDIQISLHILAVCKEPTFAEFGIDWVIHMVKSEHDAL